MLQTLNNYSRDFGEDLEKCRNWVKLAVANFLSDHPICVNLVGNDSDFSTMVAKGGFRIKLMAANLDLDHPSNITNNNSWQLTGTSGGHHCHTFQFVTERDQPLQ